MTSNGGDISTPSVPDEAIKLAMELVAADMASRGKRVWEPAQTELSKRISDLYERAHSEPYLSLSRAREFS